MTEIGIGNYMGLSFIGLVIGSWLYMLGGRDGIDKWVRRFLGSLVIASVVNLAAFVMGLWSPWLIGIYPCLVLGFCQGYGGDSIGEKVFRRLVFCFGVVSAGLLCSIVIGGNAWWLLPAHIGIALWSVYFGIISKIHAAGEELLICMVLNLVLMVYPFIS